MFEPAVDRAISEFMKKVIHITKPWGRGTLHTYYYPYGDGTWRKYESVAYDWDWRKVIKVTYEPNR